MVQSQVTFNRVPEKVQEKVGEALVRSRVKLNRVPEKVLEKAPVKVWEASVQSQVRFNRVGATSGEGSGEGLGGFGAEPGQVQQDSGKNWSGSLRCRARSGSTAFQRRFRRRCGRLQVTFNRVPDGEGSREGVRGYLVVQSQVKFNRVPKKVPEKVPGGFGRSGSTVPGQVPGISNTSRTIFPPWGKPTKWHSTWPFPRHFRNIPFIAIQRTLERKDRERKVVRWTLVVLASMLQKKVGSQQLPKLHDASNNAVGISSKELSGKHRQARNGFWKGQATCRNV